MATPPGQGDGLRAPEAGLAEQARDHGASPSEAAATGDDDMRAGADATDHVRDQFPEGVGVRRDAVVDDRIPHQFNAAGIQTLGNRGDIGLDELVVLGEQHERVGIPVVVEALYVGIEIAPMSPRAPRVVLSEQEGDRAFAAPSEAILAHASHLSASIAAGESLVAEVLKSLGASNKRILPDTISPGRPPPRRPTSSCCPRPLPGQLNELLLQVSPTATALRQLQTPAGGLANQST